MKYQGPRGVVVIAVADPSPSRGIGQAQDSTKPNIGDDIGWPNIGVIPAKALTITGALQAQGHINGQSGQNHPGDLNAFLSTVCGFDEFSGHLDHLGAMVHGWGIDTRDPTARPRWGRIGTMEVVTARIEVATAASRNTG